MRNRRKDGGLYWEEQVITPVSGPNGDRCFIATNTSVQRGGLISKLQEESGGLSGEPLRLRSEAILSRVVKKLNGRLPVVSVGGIMKPEDARRRLDMGAALVQVYTGLVYAGPGLIKQIVRAL
jgi:dihydroorotate dehydrogenase